MEINKMERDILSLRIVDLTHYMNRPVYGLDTCFSEFRAKEIKSVPVIRIFGSTADGIKTCMHIHGVLPYFYIPYVANSNESYEKFAYQLCEHLDKALNVSLGQSSSQMHHIFKVQLVKAFPFYGYHRREHLFLKIYMYNPRLLKRAANLLQNGALNGKTFQAFCSHVPYRLQFLIDYNLFPMSFLHVPLETIKCRRSDEIPIKINADQILNKNVEKLSTSSLEVDISAASILNRIEIQNEAGKGKRVMNPGIESIWNDEAVRRKLLKQKQQDIPVLEIPLPEERPGIKPTDSENFYKEALERKLIEKNSQSGDLTLDNTLLNASMNRESQFSPSGKKRKFNVTKLLKNAIYPEEYSQDDKTLDAIIVEDHLKGCDYFKTNKPTESSSQDVDDAVFDEDTLDEEEILSLSQHPFKKLNLNDTCEQGVLQFLKQLDHEDEEEPGIDMNSSLAPFSQTNDNYQKEVLEFLKNLDDEDSNLRQNNMNNISLVERSDSEDDCVNDYTIANEDFEEVLLKLSQTIPNDVRSERIPQVDGADDYLRTPKKNQRSRYLTTPSPNKKSPKTPRSSKRSRYAPLQGFKTFSPKSIIKEEDESESEAVSDSDESYRSDKKRIKRKLKRNLSRTLETSSEISVMRDRNRNQLSISAAEMKVQTESDFHKTEVKITCNLKSAKLERNLKLQKDIERKRVIRNLSTSANGVNDIETESDSDKTQIKITCNLKPTKLEKILKLQNGIEWNKTTKKKSPQTDDVDFDKTQTKITCNYRPSKREANLKINKVLKTEPKKALETSSKKNHNSRKKTVNDEMETPKSNRLETMEKKLLRSNVVKRLSSIISLSDTETPIARASSPPYKKCHVKIRKMQSPNSSLDSPRLSHDGSESLSIRESIKIPHKIEDTGSKLSNSVVQSHLFANLRELENCFMSKSETKEQHLSEIKYVEPKLEKSVEKSKKIKQCTVKVKRFNINSSEKVQEKQRRTSWCVKEHDRKLKYSPVAGPSKIITHDIKIGSRDTTLNSNAKDPPDCFKNDDILSPTNEDGIDMNICSFYDNSFFSNDSPSMFSDRDSPAAIHINSKFSNETPVSAKIRHTPQKLSRKLSDLRSHRSSRSESMSPLQFSCETVNHPNEFAEDSILKDEECDDNLPSYIKPEVVNILPFYSNPDDVRKAKEVGNFTLHIPLNLCPQNDSAEAMKAAPTSAQDTEILLKAKKAIEKYKNRKRDELEMSIVEDSPIKIQRKKIAMILNESDNESNQSLESISCTPETPKPTDDQLEKVLRSNSTTPNSLKKCKVSIKNVSLSKLLSKSLQSSSALSSRKTLFYDKSYVKDSSQSSKSPELLPQIKFVPIDVLLSDDVNVEDAVAMKTENADANTSRIVLTDLNKTVHPLALSQNRDASFGLSGNSLDNTFGFKRSLEHLQKAKADVDHNYLTTISLEVFVKTRGSLHPNPAFDEVCGVFYAVLNDVPESSKLPNKVLGYILSVDSNDKNPRMTGVEGEVTIVNSETELFEVLLKLVRFWDPDIMAGYEVELGSWGYIIERSKALQLNFIQLLSRVPSQKVYEHEDDEQKENLTDLDHESKIYGRIFLDVWRLLRSEIALTSYTFENVMYHISHRRVPTHSYQKLTEWFLSTHTRWIVLEYYLERVAGVWELLDQLDLIGRTCEMAKLIGIQFYEVLSRGSQYRVESMMLRIAKPQNLIPMSPSPQQRLHMRAPEYLPLILEPQSRFYADPLIVLDFQSLYPSVMIAYNYCFSTCLGRVEHLGSSSPFEFGVSMLRVSPLMLRKLIAYDMINISPCGAVFVKQEIREGVLPQMVREILDTRIMVKKSMKIHKSNQVLQRVLHSRQLALKLMANVTYGYTAANFSGRMPCVEIGDSVVAKGRETLERAIKLVEATPRWGAEVVYGDTDSLFVLCPGKTRETAFKIGEEIADAVTKDNPFPIKLKLEKVYQPSILQTKKRYVGFMYETADQTEPVYEAKGIETVRRDGCPATVKMLEKSLRILFQTKDVSKVKQYVCRQFTKILQGKANIQDLIFAKEFRGRFGYKPGACVPALELTRRWMLSDPRKEPRRGERVPYIVTNGPPGLPIIRLIRCPHEVLNNEGLKINAIYYITRAIIPPLNRCFLLIGADVNEWFAELPRKNTQLLQFAKDTDERKNVTFRKKKSTISQYFASTNCAIDCGRQTKNYICNDCKKDVQRCVITLQNKISKLERAYFLTQKVCQSCCGRTENIDCRALECPVLFVKEVKFREHKQVEYYNKLINQLTSPKDQFYNII